MLFKKGELKLLTPFYAYYLILGFAGMIIPFMIVYFRDINLSFLQISTIMAAFSVSMFVFEIPTGAIADSISRRKSVIAGFILAGLAILMVALTNQYWLILLLFIIIGFGMTLVSGAEEAWVMDNLNHHKRKDLQKEFFIKSQSLGAFAAIAGPLIGMLIVKTYSIKPLWFIWGGGFILGALLLLVFSREHYIPKKAKGNLFQKTIINTKKGLKYSFKHKNILYFLIANLFVGMLITDNDFWQPLLTDLGMPVHQLGIVFSIIAAITMIVPFTARYLAKYRIEKVFSIMITTRIIIFLGILLLKPGLYFIAVTIFIFSEGLFSIRHPLIEPFFQEQIPTKMRATITSIKSMGLQIGLAIGTILLGFIADKGGVQLAIPLTGIFGLFAIFFFLKINTSKTSREN